MYKATCPKCGSDDMRNKGPSKSGTSRRFSCRSCGKGSTISNAEVRVEKNDLQEELSFEDTFKVDQSKLNQEIENHDVFVITSVQNDTTTFTAFVDSLKSYVSKREGRLMVIPIRYKNPSAIVTQNQADGLGWDPSLAEYMIENEVVLSDHVKIVGDLNVQATAANPLSGLEPITQGKTSIFGHAQLAMTTVPVNQHKRPIIMTTTGTVSHGNYSDSKAGYKANFHHSNSAIVIELDRENDCHHIRQLIANEDGSFYDIYGKFNPDGTFEKLESVPGLMLGDEHVIEVDDQVVFATFDRPDSIVKRLKPEVLIRQDVLDCYSVSHHHRNKAVLSYQKYQSQKNVLLSELEEAAEYLIETTPVSSESWVIDSNHHDHLMRWLNEVNIKNEVWNAKVYHELMYLTLSAVDFGMSYINPFAFWMARNYKDQNIGGQITFIDSSNPRYIEGVLVSMHGDIGPNGARGSRKNLSKISEESMIGHSHSPGIEKGCWQVGTSSVIGLEYNKGPSGWMQTHGVIYPGGSRQLINIIGDTYYYNPREIQ